MKAQLDKLLEQRPVDVVAPDFLDDVAKTNVIAKELIGAIVPELRLERFRRPEQLSGLTE